MSLFFLSLFAFVFGACLGSFLGVLVDRASTGEQVLRGRSKCEHCRKVLETRDLIPIVSYVLLKGRCRHCNSKIPLRVLLIEVTGGMIASGLFLYAYFTGLNIIELILLLAVFFSLVGIFFADFSYGIIPDEFVATIILSSLFLLISYPQNLFQNLIVNIITGFLVFSFFLVIFLLTRGRGMGFGDVKLSFAIGLFLGFPKTIVALYVAFLTGMFISIILVLLGKKKLRGDSIAFGPFLVIGAVIGYFFGIQILNLFFK
ncbi:MAG: hypothetical protein A3C30_02155 [Candidatus Levybacteria bacterium RIFCSPHIGHO2_02_FULL_40_18]|nr:MAG: hypothetical protein A2869_04535 [Candidatus Levybacteria bacterium RIFCSPHIGHO2_01_FULL_40_58]OGH26792.1 MAG: hypothetical protein A3C30_02155 [Candidatus Levybacteria bacterium RIFCSPHIGHO2_02_FULL_40_18]OGH31727.1 MAG: hypothetical protein A3E43_01875 [Candidatus Levybacteria bacterium RIFCSPHIGHO2_12_FULL_40_31]OGH40627.1 MAG: hypothetical protein A2894_00425 [Candidatus Levybacteria bacterium RIFCSPLOWO2_01_FULL_40_64]OGH48799.1 MAG: hypothetical protein A3I54_04050 [Candidatus Lev